MVGPAEFDVSWWSGDDGVIARARLLTYDDEYIFNPDGSFRIEYQGPDLARALAVGWR